MVLPLLAMGAASILGGLFQSRSASKAAQAQQESARASNELQKYMYDQSRQDGAPWRQMGQNALGAVGYELGLGPRPGSVSYSIEERTTPGTPGAYNVQGGGAAPNVSTSYTPEMLAKMSRSDREFADGVMRQNALEQVLSGYTGNQGTPDRTEYFVGDRGFGSRDEAQQWIDSQPGSGVSDYGGFENSEMYVPSEFTADPGYQFRKDEGNKAIERMAAARGVRYGGETMKAADRFNSGLASQEYGNWFNRRSNEYGNYFNRLSGVAGTGQAQIAQDTRSGQNYAANVSANNQNAANARSSSYQAQGNIMGNTINSLGGLYGSAKGGYFGQNPGFGINPYPSALNNLGYS